MFGICWTMFHSNSCRGTAKTQPRGITVSYTTFTPQSEPHSLSRRDNFERDEHVPGTHCLTFHHRVG